MDFDINQEDPTGPCFIYALPFSNSEILIETTFFSKMIKNKSELYFTNKNVAKIPT